MPNYEHMHRKTADVGPAPPPAPPHKMVPAPEPNPFPAPDGDAIEKQVAAEERAAEAAEGVPNILGVPVPPAGENGPVGP